MRQGGFTGGGINAVTRSGTNDFEGSVYGSERNENLIGDGPFDNPIANFSEDQYGLRARRSDPSGPLFFFVNGERNRRSSSRTVPRPTVRPARPSRTRQAGRALPPTT